MENVCWSPVLRFEVKRMKSTDYRVRDSIIKSSDLLTSSEKNALQALQAKPTLITSVPQRFWM